MIKFENVFPGMTETREITLEIEYIYSDEETIENVTREIAADYKSAIVTDMESDEESITYYLLIIPAENDAEREEIYTDHVNRYQ